jgi:ferric-dicitrate binding protein FerR (iron transport regulator)
MNPINAKYDDDLIMSYLEGQSTEEEAHALLSWMGESETHQERFESFKDVWDLTSFPMPDIDSIDVESALDAVNTKIEAEENHETVVVPMPWLRRNIRYVSSAAAVLFVALFIGFMVIKPYNSNITIASNDWNTEQPYVLPDGTTVTFTGQSEITYPKQFRNDFRSVEFEGTALFDVSKDGEHPFVIHCGNMNVEVLGTSFLLEADKTSEQYQLDLYSGRVRMTTVDEKGNELSSVEVEPGERGIYNSTDGAMRVLTYSEVKYEELTNDHVLDFNNVCLSKIVETLEYIFEIKIDLPDSYANETLTARFTDKDSVDEVVETIATVFGMKVSKPTKNKFVLR